jgi:hypothetical protein
MTPLQNEPQQHQREAKHRRFRVPCGGRRSPDSDFARNLLQKSGLGFHFGPQNSDFTSNSGGGTAEEAKNRVSHGPDLGPDSEKRCRNQMLDSTENVHDGDTIVNTGPAELRHVYNKKNDREPPYRKRCWGNSVTKRV